MGGKRGGEGILREQRDGAPTIGSGSHSMSEILINTLIAEVI